MFVIGVFPVSFGGDIGSRLGIAQACGEMHVDREELRTQCSKCAEHTT